MLTQKHKHAVRAFNRIFAKTAEKAEQAWRGDRGFDGGEWSDGFHAVQIHIAYDEIANYVAARFSIEYDEMLSAIQHEMYENELNFLRSKGILACGI